MTIENFEETTISRKSVFKGKIIEVVVDEVNLPSGDVATRELVFHSGAVGILPITKDNQVILVRQYRKPLEKVMLEIPAGKIDDTDQNPLETAKRELEEETGYQAQNVQLISSLELSPGYSNEVLHLYEATGLEKVEHPLPQDEDELIELYYYTLEEVKELIKNGEITDGKTIVGIQYWELKRLREKLK